MNEPHKGFRRLAATTKPAKAPKPSSPRIELCDSILKATQLGQYEQVDSLIRNGLSQRVLDAAELRDFQAVGDKNDQYAWSSVTARASEMLRYGKPDSQLVLSGWQIASWCGKADSGLSPGWLFAARQACKDILATGLDMRRPLGISPRPEADGCKDLQLPAGIHMIRFSREGDHAKSLPGHVLEKILPNQDNMNYEESDLLHFAQRTSPFVLIEATNHSYYDDERHHPGCDGVAYFSADPSTLDAFIASRPTLEIREHLFEQAARGSRSVLRAIDAGFPVDLSSNWRPSVQRLIHKACTLANSGIVDGLLERGANPNRRSDEYISPAYSLFRLAMREKESDTEQALKSLIMHGLSLSDHDCKEHGEIPLHKAARNDWPVIAATLLGMGADPLMPNDKGQTPMDIAKARAETRGQSDCAALFDAWSAKERIQKIREASSAEP